MDKLDAFFTLLAVAGIIGLIGIALYNFDKSVKCSERGGIYTRTMLGYECVRGDLIELRK